MIVNSGDGFVFAENIGDVTLAFRDDFAVFNQEHNFSQCLSARL
jgi:hypothetical protein